MTKEASIRLCVPSHIAYEVGAGRQRTVRVLTASKVVTKDPVLLLGPSAAETAFKSEPLADFKIVHIAAHGFVDRQFPERSGLVLGYEHVQKYTAR